MESDFSRIIAGTMTWGTWGKNLDANQMSQLIAHCVENNIDTFDHADIYGGYTTEETFGHAIKLQSTPRERLKLISKCGIQYPSAKRPLPVKYYDYSAEYIVWSVEQSLVNLQTDYLDLLLLHRPSPLMRPDEVALAVDKLKAAGKIKAFGVSNFTASQTDLLMKSVEVSYNQIQFSLTNPAAMTDGSLDHMKLQGIRPMAWNPLGTVFREVNEQTGRIKALLVQLMAKYDAAPDVILLAWIMQHPSGIHPVFGTTGMERISQLPNSLEIKLDMEDWFLLWVESRGVKVP